MGQREHLERMIVKASLLFMFQMLVCFRSGVEMQQFTRLTVSVSFTFSAISALACVREFATDLFCCRTAAFAMHRRHVHQRDAKPCAGESALRFNGLSSEVLGTYQICRHHYYHVEDSIEARRRRKGKPLRACLAIVRETQHAMAGRIITFRQHPWERPTAYALDVQDLRRTLPPHMRMPSESLEPGDTEYPPRIQGLISFNVFLLIS